MRATILIVVFCQVISSVLSQQECQSENVERCAQDLKELYSNRDGPVIVKSENELRTLCGHQQKALGCINQFVDRCLPETQKTVFVNLTMGVQEFVSDFCSEDSRIRKIYVKHLGCFNKVADKVHHCTQNLHNWHKDVERNRQSQEETIRQACCRYDNAMDCIRTVVRDGCPDEAANLFDQMISKVTKHFIQVAQCGRQKYDVRECSSAPGFLPFTLVILGSLLFALSSTFSKRW